MGKNAEVRIFDILTDELWTFRSQDHSLPGAKVPGVELSLPGTFAPWNLRSLELSLPGTFAPTDECRPSKASSDSSTNKYRPTCT